MDKRAAQVAQDEVSGRPAASLSGTVVTDRLAFSHSLALSQVSTFDTNLSKVLSVKVVYLC
jgi:hypothetical protein